jgi:hypothetical protein
LTRARASTAGVFCCREKKHAKAVIAEVAQPVNAPLRPALPPPLTTCGNQNLRAKKKRSGIQQDTLIAMTPHMLLDSTSNSLFISARVLMESLKTCSKFQYLRQNENRLKTTLFLRLFSCPKMAKLEIGEGIEIWNKLPSG